jgi:hypothetical protein
MTASAVSWRNWAPNSSTPDFRSCRSSRGPRSRVCFAAGRGAITRTGVAIAARHHRSRDRRLGRLAGGRHRHRHRTGDRHRHRCAERSAARQAHRGSRPRDAGRHASACASAVRPSASWSIAPISRSRGSRGHRSMCSVWASSSSPTDMHPETGQPYDWPLESLAEITLDDLPRSPRRRRTPSRTLRSRWCRRSCGRHGCRMRGADAAAGHSASRVARSRR